MHYFNDKVRKKNKKKSTTHGRVEMIDEDKININLPKELYSSIDNKRS
jgi:hypothetical protein